MNHMEVLTLVHHLKVSILFYLLVKALTAGDACGFPHVVVFDTVLFISLNL